MRVFTLPTALTVVVLWAVAGLILTVPLESAEPKRGLPPDSWWPEWRRDGHRSGRCTLAGAIKRPAEKWRYFLGAPHTARVDDPTEKPVSDLRDLDGDGVACRLNVVGNVFSVEDVAKGVTVFRYELKDRQAGYHPPVVADFDSARPGLESIIWPVDGNYYGDSKDQAYCFGFASGAKDGRLLWTAEPPVGKVHAASLMVASANSGGSHDLVVLSWDGITVWEGTTGKLAESVAWPAVRHYGMGACVRFPADGPLYVINVADYVPHVHVAELGGPEGARLLWGRHYAKTGEPTNRLLRARPNSVSDLDGDGAPEIVFSLYNERDDGKWHLVVLDARTGDAKLDDPGRFVWGIEDLDGDGISELLCTGAPLDPHALAELTVCRFTDSGLRQLWSLRGARFLLKDVKAVPPDSFNGAADGRAMVFVTGLGGERVFLVERDGDGDGLPECFEGYALDRHGAVTQRGHYKAPRGAVVNARSFTSTADGGQLQFCDLASGDLVTVDMQGNELARARGAVGGYATVPVAADVDCDGRCEIAVVNSRREVELLGAPLAGRSQEVVRRWHRPGQGMVLYQGYTPPNLTLGLADVNGDGTLEVLASGIATDGSTTLAALRPDGRVLWEQPFPGVGADGIYSGVTRWFTGRFLGHKGKDVGVVYHGLGNGAHQLAVLDGRTGKLAWGPLETVPLPSGGRAFLSSRPLQSIHDFDGDGNDDFAFHDVYSTVILSGVTGKLMHGRGVVETYGRTLNYAYLMLAERTAGAPDLVLHGPHMHTMAQTYDMKKLWFRDWGMQANHFLPALALIDNKFVLGMPGEDGVFRCVDARGGETIWEEKIGRAGASSVGSADVDGDRLPDFFYVDKGGKLVVVRGKVRPGENRILWEYPVGAAQDPIFVDADGDGKGEFLLVTADGYMRCIGQASE